MKKKFISLAISAILMLNILPVFATGEYYAYRELNKITGEMLEYERVDASVMEKTISEMRKLTKGSGNEDAVVECVDKCFDVFLDIYNAYSLAMLAYDRDTNDTNKHNMDEASKMCVNATEYLSDMVYLIYESRYRDLLIDIFGDTEVALSFALPQDDEISYLIGEEVSLTNKYNEIYGDTDACAKLYVELVKIRNKIARKYGYDNFAEYANECLYDRDITDDELTELRDGAKESVYELYCNSIWAMYYTIGTESMGMTEDDILLTARSAAGRINGELLDSFDYMIENNLYDIRERDTKNDGAGAYTISLPKLGVPYMYINPYEPYSENGALTVSDCIHEFGHFSAMLNDPIYAVDKYNGIHLSADMETAEIHSQGLEALSERHFGKLYGKEAAYQRYRLLCTLSWAVLQGMMYNEWQTEVYSMENPTVDGLNMLLQKLCEKYMDVEYTEEEAQTEWTQLHHNYIQPMYYLSYALSGMAVLKLYSESLTDYSGAVDKYMQISAEGIFADFDNVIEAYALDGIYNKNSIKNICDTISGAYGFSYYDIEEDAWYTPYVYSTSNIMSGITNSIFMPDESITRSDFVGAIGRMYDYYVGIDGEYETSFKDICENDKNSEYIAWASATGVIDGYSDDIFGGSDTLTREQAAAIICRLGEYEPDDNTSISIFTDYSEVSDWARESVGWMAENAIIEGRDNGEFAPKSEITRAETAKILSGYIDSEY